jgi:hypothetical protein
VVKWSLSHSGSLTCLAPSTHAVDYPSCVLLSSDNHTCGISLPRYTYMSIPCPLPVSEPRSRRQATLNQTFPQQRTVALTDKSKRASWSQVGARASDRARAVSDVDVSEQLHLGVWQASERSIKASCCSNSMWAILRYLTTGCVVVG